MFNLYNNQVGVDLVLERGGEVIPIEIKLTRSPTAQMAPSIRSFSQPMRVQKSLLVPTREESLTLAEGIASKHWYKFLRGVEFE